MLHFARHHFRIESKPYYTYSNYNFMKLLLYGRGKKKYCVNFMVARERRSKGFLTCREMLDFASDQKCLYIDACSEDILLEANRLNHRILRCKSWVFA